MRIDGPQITGSFSLNGDGVQDLESLATTSSLNSYTSSINTTMGHVMTATHSLNTFTSSASSRISTIESSTSSLNSFSNSINSYTSSNDSTNTTQNSRLTSIEGKSGSYATTGSNTFVGTQTIQGSIVPSAHATYDLGSAGYNFRHLYLSSASLYIDGTKVLGSTTQELQITTDNGQSFKILEAGSDTITLQSADGNITLATSGGGDVILDPTTGIIALKGTTQVYAGNKVRSSDGNNIVFGDGLTVSGSVTITGFIEAQELRTTYISSSILYRSGSTKFGDELTDTHAFTGSLLVSGSISVPGSGLISGSSQILNGSGVWSGSAQLPSGVVSGSAQIDVMSTTNIGRLATTGSNTFSGGITATGNATTTPSFIANNAIGSSGTAQHYLDFTAGATTIGRILRGNGANGLVANGINIDNYGGFQVRLNQLGGNGDVFNISGGNMVITGSLTSSGNIRTDGVVNWNGTVGALSYGGGTVTMETNTAVPILIKTNGTTAITVSTGQTVTFAGDINLGGNILTGVDKAIRFDSSGASGHPEISIDSNVDLNFKNSAGVVNLLLKNNGDTILSGSLTTTGNINVNSDGAVFNRSSSGEPYLFFKKSGVNRGSIYGITGGGLRMFDQSDNQVFTMTGSMIGISETVPTKKLTVNYGSSVSDGLLVTGSQRQETRFKSSGEHSNVFIDSAHSNIYLPTLGLLRNGTSFGEVKLQRASNSDSIGSYTESEMIMGSTTTVPVSIKTNEVRRVIIESGGIVNVYNQLNQRSALRMNSSSAGNSPRITFGTEDESVPGNKSIYLENYWMVLQPHVNEGMRVRFVNGSGTQTETVRFQSSATSVYTSLSVSGNFGARNFNNAIKSWSTNGSYTWSTELSALAGYFDSACWYKGFIRESNGAHYNGYQFDIHVGQIGYGGAANQFIVRNMTYAGGPWTGGCGGSSFASIDNSGFTKQNSGCFDSLELFITRLG